MESQAFGNCCAVEISAYKTHMNIYRGLIGGGGVAVETEGLTAVW